MLHLKLNSRTRTLDPNDPLDQVYLEMEALDRARHDRNLKEQVAGLGVILLALLLVAGFTWIVLGNTPMVLVLTVIFGIGLLWATLAGTPSGQYS
jgi:cobalamin biosynthesis protein CobD/CbiB